MRGIKTIDLMMGLNLQDEEETGAGVRRMIESGWLRDPDSLKYTQPAQHFFKDSPDRIKRGNTVEELIALMDEVGIERGLVGCDLHNPRPVLDVVERYPDRFFISASVDPFRGMPELRALESLVRDHPHVRAASMAALFIQKPYNDKIYWPLYAKLCDLDIPVLCTVGLPGPRVPGDSQNPMYLDEPLWFFPELKIIMRHGGEPWTSECVKLMLKWPNLSYSPSAFAPRHYPKDVMYFASTRGANQVMYAGYWPGLDLRRIAREIEEELELRDHVWPLFLRENALRLFKLEGGIH